MEKVEIPEIPLETIREAIINSLIHRDFKIAETCKKANVKVEFEIRKSGFTEKVTDEIMKNIIKLTE